MNIISLKIVELGNSREHNRTRHRGTDRISIKIKISEQQ